MPPAPRSERTSYRPSRVPGETDIGCKAIVSAAFRQPCLQLADDHRGIGVHRFSDANQLDDVESPRTVLDLREIRRRQFELCGDVGLLEVRTLACPHQNLAEYDQLVGELGLGRNAILPPV